MLTLIILYLIFSVGILFDFYVIINLYSKQYNMNKLQYSARYTLPRTKIKI